MKFKLNDFREEAFKWLIEGHSDFFCSPPKHGMVLQALTTRYPTIQFRHPLKRNQDQETKCRPLRYEKTCRKWFSSPAWKDRPVFLAEVQQEADEEPRQVCSTCYWGYRQDRVQRETNIVSNPFLSIMGTVYGVGKRSCSSRHAADSRMDPHRTTQRSELWPPTSCWPRNVPLMLWGCISTSWEVKWKLVLDLI